VAAILAILAAVAGGNLVVTTAPNHPHVGGRVIVRSTGQVNDKGRFWLYRNLHSKCAASQSGEPGRGILLARRSPNGSFDFTTSYRARRARTEWVCGYLYAISCDAAGRNCGAATGLPPDAGWFQVRVRVRPASQSTNSSAASGRVIT
jgi:hypothetical protein